MDEPSIVSLVHGLRSHDPESSRAILERHGPHLMRVVRRKLSRKLRRVADTEDFAQAVWKSLFEHASELATFQSDDELAGYLATMAANKICSAKRHQFALKRDLRRVVSLGDNEAPDVIGNQPTPSQFAIAEDEWERMTDGLSERDRQILALRAAGNTFAEIAETIAANERTVRRVMDRLASKREPS